MATLIVPDSLNDAINASLDAAYEEVPEAAQERDLHYRELLTFFADHGYLPPFTLQKRTP